MPLPAQDIPYKPDDEFTIRPELGFKMRPIDGSNKIDYTETQKEFQRRTDTSQLPFLTLHVAIKEARHGEVRMRIMRDGKVITNNRKFDLDREFPLEVGFTDDAKDGIAGYEHVLFFLDSSKQEVSRIVIRIERNGDYFINGQRMGRF